MRRHARLLVEAKGDEGSACATSASTSGWYLTGYPVGPERRGRSRWPARSPSSTGCSTSSTRRPSCRPAPSGCRAGTLQGPRTVTLPEGWRDTWADPTPPEGADVLTSGG